MAALHTMIQGFRHTITAELERAIRTLDMANDLTIHSGLYEPLCHEAAGAIVYCHNLLQMMTGAGDRANEFTSDTPPNPQFAKDASLQYLRQEITFVLGAISDPFLGSVNQEYQDGAVLNFHKAREVLAGRIQWLQSDGHFRVTTK